jgi:hypothetical protein
VTSVIDDALSAPVRAGCCAVTSGEGFKCGDP